MSDVLNEALRLGREAATQGFDWDAPGDVLDKLAEELAELRQELSSEPYDAARSLDELGDVFFCLVNLARKLNLDPAAAVLGANDKFRRRYAHVQAHLDAYAPIGDPRRIGQMEARWREAKRIERGQPASGEDED